MTQPALFTPLSLRTHTMRNRIWVPPMCMYSCVDRDGVATEFHHAHYGAMALGKPGMIIVEATAVCPEGRISFHDLGLWNDEQRDALEHIARFMADQGVIPGIQLGHAGRKASTYPGWGFPGATGTVPPAEGGWEILAPSAMPLEGHDVPTELDQAGIDAVVSDFADAARRAVDAGFQALEIHGAHGYLIHQFLSPLSNRREDDYGGALSNRARLLLDVVRGIREAVGADPLLLVRFSATDWVEGGWNEEETAIVTDWVKDLGVDLVDISTGGLVTGVKIPLGPGYQVPMAHFVKEHAHLPVTAVGLITEAQQANDIVESGRADAVLVGREMLRNPHFPLQAAAELGAEIDYAPAQYLRAPFSD